MSELLQSRAAIEEFLYREAELLDDWRLPEWADLFTDDARYDIAQRESGLQRDSTRSLRPVNSRAELGWEWVCLHSLSV